MLLDRFRILIAACALSSSLLTLSCSTCGEEGNTCEGTSCQADADCTYDANKPYCAKGVCSSSRFRDDPGAASKAAPSQASFKEEPLACK